MKVIGVIIGMVLFMAAYVWGAMLLAGAIAGWFGWYSLGYGQTWAMLTAIGIVGSSFNGSKNRGVK